MTDEAATQAVQATARAAAANQVAVSTATQRAISAATQRAISAAATAQCQHLRSLGTPCP